MSLVSLQVDCETTLDAFNRQLVLKDALIEFVGKRVGWPSDDDLKVSRARQYVKERYPDKTPEQRDAKVLDVLERCKYAAAVLTAVREACDGE